MSARVNVTDPLEAGRWLLAEVEREGSPLSRFSFRGGRLHEDGRPARSANALRAEISRKYEAFRVTRRGEEHALFPTAAVTAAAALSRGRR